MKHFLYFLSAMVMLMFTVQISSCSNDNDEETPISELEKNFLSIEGATYFAGEFPSATTTETLDGVDMSSQVMNGAMNYVTIVTEKNLNKFFVAIKGVSGYYEYIPDSQAASGASERYNSYVIPLMMSLSYTGNSTIVISGQLDNGDITAPVENEIFYIETKSGEIEVKLAFSNSKDIDLHLYTPSGEHIYYGNRGGTNASDDGSSISYGLDIDSNAGCNIDNVNKENIYIPSELVEEGEYTVVVDMYENCNASISTSWSVIARYQGELITPTSGVNPASGVYPVGAGNRDMTVVMRFSLLGSSNGSSRSIQARKMFTPIPLTDMDQIKLWEREN